MSKIVSSELFPIKIKDLIEKTGLECELNNIDENVEVLSVVCSEISPVQKGCLFIPYKEPENDIEKICNEYAAVVLTDRIFKNIPHIYVKDIAYALKKISLWMYEYINIPSVTVSGSEGKTTTKRMVASVLGKENKVYCKYDNYNSLHSLCTEIQEIDAGTDFVVHEVDERREYVSIYSSEVLKPDVAVITNIAEAHLGFFGSFERLSEEFLNITAGMKEDGVVIINGDENNEIYKKIDKNVISVGIRNKNADCIAENIKNTRKGTQFDIAFRGEKAKIKLSVYGEHNVYDAMFAFVTGKLKGISTQQIKEALFEFRNSGIRQNVCSSGLYTVYADCYNASLTSIGFALKSFSEISKFGKKAAVIGDIAEIEGFERETYLGIAEAINKSAVGAVITYGKDSKLILDFIKKDIVKRHAESEEELNEYIKEIKRKGYFQWLFKASRIMRLEKNINASFPYIYQIMMSPEVVNTQKRFTQFVQYVKSFIYKIINE